MKMKIAFLFTLLGININAFAVPEPYSSLQLLPEYPFSYYANAKQMKDIFDRNPIRVVVEVGSWIGGGSTKHLGELLKGRGGTLYAVDTWMGSSTQQLGEIHYQDILPQVYEQFLSNMIHWDLTEVVVPCRMKSLEASMLLDVQADLIYIDGEHTTEAVYEDLTAWYLLVKGRGILCGDDWVWESVKIAVEQFALENTLLIEASENFWRLKEVSTPSDRLQFHLWKMRRF